MASTMMAAVTSDWARPVVHWEIVARDPERQARFYRELFNWDVGSGPIMQVPAGLGGPEAGIGGHIRQGDEPAVALYVQVRELRSSLERALELGGVTIAEPFDVPGGPTLAVIQDPEENVVVLVQQ